MSDPGAHYSKQAEELFAQHFRQRDDGAGPDLDRLCAANPGQERELRSLAAALEVIRRLRAELLPDAPLSERLRSRFGPEVGPTLSLEEEPKPDAGPSSRILDKLRAAAPRGSRYKLLGEIARGGMGAILKIWDDELRRPLAMKVVLGRSEASSGGTPQVPPRTLRRFLEEAQVTGQLDHPGIVPVHELGLGQDGRVYFTMRLVKGEDLRAIFGHILSGHDGWSQVRALGVMLRVCEAMSYAHAKRVVHRDLKPANVMVGKFGEVYVMDWGLARVLGHEDKHDLRIAPQAPASMSAVKTDHPDLDHDSPDSPLVTMDGDVVGTPSFMSPEQAKGQLEKLGAHSDVYAVGAMLYQLLGGEMPYVPRDARVSPNAVLMAVMHGPPRPLTEIAPSTPDELIAIVDKAMAREIDDRYPTMLALAEDLRAYIEGRVVHAYETGAWAEARKWIKRNRPLAASLAAALAILVGGVITSLIYAGEARDQAARADEKTREALRLADAESKAKEESRRSAEQAQLAREEAEQKSNDVLSLSASKDLEGLVARAEKLWPAHPDLIPRYEQWLAEARALIDGRSVDPAQAQRQRPSLEQHKAKLAELRRRATPQSDEEKAAQMRSHPRHGELALKRAERTWRARMLGDEPWPSEAQALAELARESLPTDAAGLRELALPMVDTDNRRYGDEVKGHLLISRALSVASDEERPGLRHGLACAKLNLGRFDDALAEEERAVREAPPNKRKEFEARLARMQSSIEHWKGDEALRAQRKKLEALAPEILGLETEVGERRTWAFADPEDAWWEVQLSKLVSELESLRDPKTGLMCDTLAPPFGWGVQRRLAYAQTIQARSVEDPEVVKRWRETIQAIAASPNYGGLRLSPQLDLIPIGADPSSGLFEFSHPQTGEVAVRSANGEFEPSDQLGIVFVLIPGGTFRMGAQRADPDDHNYDPGAMVNESPVHEVELSPYFLSKFEMTQGQWERISARQPSKYGPSLNINRHQHSLIHPVESVSWDDCMEMLSRMRLSLPSEAQWEFACRGGTRTPWWTGAERESLRGFINLADKAAKDGGATWGSLADWPDFEDGWGVHAPVGTFAPNAFGLHEMAGNVVEWCLDGYDGKYYVHSPRKDPVCSVGTAVFRTLRGGSYRDAASTARSADRGSNTSEYRNYFLGVRPARSVEP